MASLGIDIGTTSIKVCIIENLTLKTLLSKTLNHSQSSKVILNDVRFAEQGPLQILRKVDECMQVVANAINENEHILGSRNISSIAVTGQMHGILLWSKRRDQLSLSSSSWVKDVERSTEIESNLITWEDQRCDTSFINSLPPSCTPIYSGYGCATLYWLCRHEPFMVKNSQCAGSIMDLLVSSLCNFDQPIMSDQIANSWGYFDKQACSWQSDLLSEHNFPVELLPQICVVGSTIGFLSTNWYFIPKGTAVKVAAGDFQCSFLSSCKDENTAVINIGTSAQLAVILPSPLNACQAEGMLNSIQLFPYFGGRQLAVAASLNGGNVVNQFVKMLVSWQQDLGLGHVDEDYIHSKLKTLTQGNSAHGEKGGLKIIPIINGERHNMNNYGEVLNIHPNNISLKNVVQELYVGIITNLFQMMPLSFLQSLGIKQIACTGSFFNDNKFAENMLEKISSLQCIKTDDTDAAYGAALLSLVS